jgi:hypothetical protein
VAYDEELARRIRELLSGEPDLTEQKMFGGLAFLIGGHMSVAASGEGGALVRVDPAQSKFVDGLPLDLTYCNRCRHYSSTLWEQKTRQLAWSSLRGKIA